MARLVKKIDDKPKEVNGVWICMCGLSSSGTCTGAHKRTQGEDPSKTYIYDDEKRIEV